MSDNMTIPLFQAVESLTKQPTSDDYWFLVGQPVPEEFRVGHEPETTQRLHFESRLRQVAKLDGASSIHIDRAALDTVYAYSAAMAQAIDQMIRLQDRNVSIERLAAWADEYRATREEAGELFEAVS